MDPKPKTLSLPEIAKLYNISLRSLKRVRFVYRHAVPEFFAWAEGEGLELGTAEHVARWPHDYQRYLCRLPPAERLPMIKAIRRGEYVFVRGPVGGLNPQSEVAA